MAEGTRKSSTAIVVIVIGILLAIGLLLWACNCFEGGSSGSKTAENPKPVSGRTATIIAVNDIYRIAGVGEKEDGGLHRLRTLRKEIEKERGKVLLLHAGDFLSPALEGRVFKGEQMIDAMNNLDGEPKKFDSRMFVAFGNHEFDDSDCRVSPAPLMARLNESQFTWLDANLDFSKCESMKEVPAHKNVKRSALVDVGGIRIGIFGLGLTPDTKNATKYPRYGDLYAAARAAIKELRDKKADVIVGLTHQDAADDTLLLRALSDDGLDMIVGGHEHERAVLSDAHGIARGFKSDSDATTARVIRITLPSKGRATITHELKTLSDNDKIARDPAMAKLARKWADMAQAKLCAERHKAGRNPDEIDCLQRPAGAAQFPIKLEEKDNRNTESEFGKWIAETVRKATGADIAIVGSGSLGLNTNLDKGAMLQLEQVVDIFRFDDVVAVRKVPMSVVCAAVRHGFARPGSGAWPHVAGIKSEKPGSSAAEILKNWQAAIVRDNGTPFSCADETTTVKVASSPYVLCGGDSYPLMVDKGEEGDKCQDALRHKTGDRDKYPEGRLISVIAEQTIKNDKGLVFPPNPGE